MQYLYIFLFMAMFAVLNRVRGTSINEFKLLVFLKNDVSVGLVIGLIVYLSTAFTNTEYFGLWYLLIIPIMLATYKAGESFGWGDWVGPLTSNGNVGNQYRNGKIIINRLVGRVIRQKKTQTTQDFWYDFSIVALALRGVIWWGITFIPFLVLWIISVRQGVELSGAISPIQYILYTIVLGALFPISCLLGNSTKDFWKGKFFNNGWEQQEWYYGALQGWYFYLILFN